MKLLGLLIILSLITACDPWGFDFKKNPAYVLNEAFQAVITLNPEAFREVTGREAFCLYGNMDGLSYLRQNLNVAKKEDVEINPKLIANSSRYHKSAVYKDFWTFYTERYTVDILEKSTKKEFLQVAVECDYGFDDKKEDRYANMKLKKYKRKDCRVIKIIPKDFSALPMREECVGLAVKL